MNAYQSTSSFFNWVGNSGNREQTDSAKLVLAKTKHDRYKTARFKLVKIKDMPLTFKEVLMTEEEIAEADQKSKPKKRSN